MILYLSTLITHGLVCDSSIHLFSNYYDLSRGAIYYHLAGTGTQSSSHTSSANWKHILQTSRWAFEAWREWYIFPLLFVLSFNFVRYIPSLYFFMEWALSVSLFGIFLFYSARAYVTEIEGLKRKLTSKLGANSPALVPDWQVTLLGYLQL